MCITHDGAFLVTGSQESCKFWSVADIPKLGGAGEEESGGEGEMAEEGEEEGEVRKKRRRRRKKRTKVHDSEESGGESKAAKVDFFADL